MSDIMVIRKEEQQLTMKLLQELVSGSTKCIQSIKESIQENKVEMEAI